MQYDLIIKNGRIADGTGLPSYVGDVAVKDGKIAAMGRISARASRVIDAEGLVVSPGFIDMHTHYDAQLHWDPLATSSCWHGITTVMTGNCGFAIAPCKPKDREYTMRMFGNVEGVSLPALKGGLGWNWESFPQFLDALDKPLGVNAAVQVGHSALRYYVMGEASLERAATSDEVRKQKQLLAEALKAGAFGFTTSRSVNHLDMNMHPVPSVQSTNEETLELASVFRDHPVGVIGFHPYDRLTGFDWTDAEFMAELSLASGRSVNYNELSYAPHLPDQWKQQIRASEEAFKRGAQVYGINRCQRLDLEFTLKDTYVFDRLPYWKEVMRKPIEERKRLFRDPAVRKRLQQDLDDPALGEMVARRRLEKVGVTLTVKPQHAKLAGKMLTDLAKEQRTSLLDAMLDLSLSEDLETEFAYIGVRNNDEAIVAQILKCPYGIAGISDGGAHMDNQTGADFNTYLLGHWVRERKDLTLEEAVSKLTFVPASVIGLWDRGLLKEGLAADIAIFDLNTVAPLRKQRVYDLPGGDVRVIQKAQGVKYTIVNGVPVSIDGAPTGDLPGTLLRSGRYTNA